jgi:hypothetical protein
MLVYPMQTTMLCVQCILWRLKRFSKHIHDAVADQRSDVVRALSKYQETHSTKALTERRGRVCIQKLLQFVSLYWSLCNHRVASL